MLNVQMSPLGKAGISRHDPHSIRFPFHCGYVPPAPRPKISKRSAQKGGFQKDGFSQKSITQGCRNEAQDIVDPSF